MAANNSIVADAVLEDKLADLWPDYPCLYDVRCPEFKNRELRETQDFTHVFRLAALKRLRLRRSIKRESKTSSSSDELESRFSPTSAILTSIKHGKDACAFALIPELIAQNARTL